jgi:cyclophilin family peptidyl-prolyl cis-trans isomerase
MFKENKEFWIYIIGTIILFVILIFGMKSYFNSSSLALLLLPPLKQPSGVTLVYDTPPVINLVKDTDYFARIKTNKGDFVIDLFEKSAPNTVNNFIYLASQKYYDGTKFHRLIPGLLIQGGSRNTLNSDPNDDAFGGPGYVIDDEINWDSLGLDQATKAELTTEGYSSNPKLTSVDVGKYRIAMANAGANTSGSQFFILLSGLDNPDVVKLRGKYTVFAEVIGNREVVDQLASTPINNQLSGDPRPDVDLVVNSVEIIQN